MSKVSVIIVSYNSRKQLEKYLSSVLEQTYPNIEIIIIDNGSAIETTDYLKSLNTSSIKIKYNGTNAGFAAGQNQGIKIAEGAYILSLNPDVRLSKTFIEKMISAADSSDKIGMVNGKILRIIDGINSNIIDCAGTILTKERALCNRGEGEIDTGKYNSGKDIFGVCGSASLFKRKMLEDVCYDAQYYDEELFCYAEDFDLSWRSRIAGWQAYYEKEAVAYHEVSASSPSSDFAKTMIFRNRYLIMLKNEMFVNVLFNMHHIFVYEITNMIRVIFQPGLIFMMIKNIPLFWKILRKRKFLSSYKYNALSIGRRLPSGKGDMVNKMKFAVGKLIFPTFRK